MKNREERIGIASSYGNITKREATKEYWLIIPIALPGSDVSMTRLDRVEVLHQKVRKSHGLKKSHRYKDNMSTNEGYELI